MVEGDVDICTDAGSQHCSGAFFYSQHRCGAGILVLSLTVLNMKKDLRGRCCGLTAAVITLSDKHNLATVIQPDCLL